MKKKLAPKEKPALIEIFESVLGNGGVLPKLYEPAVGELKTNAIIWKVTREDGKIKVALYDAQKTYYEIYKKMYSGSFPLKLLWKILLPIAEPEDINGLEHSIKVAEKIRRKIMSEKTPSK